MKKLLLLTILICFCSLPISAKAQNNLALEEGIIATKVKDLIPEGIGDTFPSNIKKLYCYTKITGGEQGDMIYHKWYYGDKLMASPKLAIKSAEYRTYSSKNILDTWVGEWKVKIVNSKNNQVLSTLYFTIE